MNKKIILGIIILITTIISTIFIFTKNSNIIWEENKFDKTPAFTLEDWDGNEVNLSDFEDTALIFNTWATWCPFCVKEMPDFAILQEEFGDKIVVILINRSESTERQKEFTDKIGVTERLIFLNDPKDSFYRSIGGFGMPETLFVDSEGNILLHKRGPIGLEQLRELAKLIIK